MCVCVCVCVKVESRKDEGEDEREKKNNRSVIGPSEGAHLLALLSVSSLTLPALRPFFLTFLRYSQPKTARDERREGGQSGTFPLDETSAMALKRFSSRKVRWPQRPASLCL